MEAILGQMHAVEQLQGALGGGRMHHAWIFHGPIGVGKFTTAMELSRFLLCQEPQRDLVGRLLPCAGCEGCRMAASSSHPDLHVITKELALFSDDKQIRDRKLMTIPVDVLRDALLGPVYLASQAGGNKVFIVDEAELINAAGQNAMLKTLEEPPAGTYIILITANEDRLLPTVRSRCQRVAFVPLPDEEVDRWLLDNHTELDDRTRRWLVSFAEGSFGQARLAVSYNLSEWADVVIPAIDRSSKGQYPIGLGADIAERIGGFAERWVADHTNASKEAANKQAAGLMWRLIGQIARSRIAAIAASCDPTDPVSTEAAMASWLAMLDGLEIAQRELGANVNMGIVTDHLVSMIHRALNGETEMACVTE